MQAYSELIYHLRSTTSRILLHQLTVVGVNSSLPKLSSSREGSKAACQSQRKGRGRASSQKTAVKSAGGGGGENADTADSHLSPIGSKDTTFVLFRALGKILYCKRTFAWFLFVSNKFFSWKYFYCVNSSFCLITGMYVAVVTQVRRQTHLACCQLTSLTVIAGLYSWSLK